MAAISDAAAMPVNTTSTISDDIVAQPTVTAIDIPTTFRARPSVFIAGARLALFYPHMAIARMPIQFSALS